MPNLVETIQEIVKNTNNALELADVLFGTVTDISPIKILVEQKLELTNEFLILTRNVKDYTVNVTVQNWITENITLNNNHRHTTNNENVQINDATINFTHGHDINGKKKITIHNALNIGDKVILLKQKRWPKVCSIR